MELPPDDDVEGYSTLNRMLAWYKFNCVIGPFHFYV